jgi:hypothetical protein
MGRSRPFDIEIEFEAGSWYVHLWSPEKVYQAELGVRSDDGTFAVLAQSNKIETPPAWPHPPGTSGIDTPVFPADPLPEPQIQAEPNFQAVPHGHPKWNPRPVPEPAPQRAREAVGQPIADPFKIDPAILLQPKLAALLAEHRASDPALLASKQAEISTSGLTEATGGLNPVESPEDYLMDREIPEAGLIYEGVRGELPHRELADGELAISDPRTLKLDLTQYAEERFIPGIFSDGGRLVR